MWQGECSFPRLSFQLPIWRCVRKLMWKGPPAPKPLAAGWRPMRGLCCCQCRGTILPFLDAVLTRRSYGRINYIRASQGPALVPPPPRYDSSRPMPNLPTALPAKVRGRFARDANAAKHSRGADGRPLMDFELMKHPIAFSDEMRETKERDRRGQQCGHSLTSVPSPAP